MTEKKEWITQELSTGYSPAIPEGTKLQIIYDSDDPTNLVISSVFELEILPRLFIALGACGLLFGGLEYLNMIDLIPD